MLDEWWIDFVAGWISGGVSVVACQPLDTLLTRYQARPLLAQGSEILDVKGLWRGSSPMIGAVPLQNALLMGGYGIGKHYSSGNLLPVFVGGCVGGVLQSFLMSPVEWIKVQRQTTNQRTNSMMQLFGRSWHKGLTATLLRDGIPHGVWFASYEYCKNGLLNASEEEEGRYTTVTVPVVSGAFAATTAWAVGYPFDIIKTRIQAAPQHLSLGVYETGRELVREANGNLWRGLYRGFGWKLVRSIPASMIGFFTYEYVSQELKSI